ncbi:RRQRL motif-containing zinc-binding protein [Nocardia beijingensis]|uniref:RRQRL motif-containing zinc-binding protein n=1 Tax=Nocardia beijingensis TaxID=95162 RepID=UPI0033F6189E
MSEGIPTYRWRMAPGHLRTKRQLEAAGLRPNGQDIQGRIPFRRYGHDQVAHLFDVNKAAPKRSATPAQLAALAKATREHQLRAAERHGVDRADFDQAGGDPGPGWNTSTNALADYRPGSSLADVLGRETEREGYDR